MSLELMDRLRFLVMRRVSRDKIHRSGGQWLDHYHQPLSVAVSHLLDQLFTEGQVVIGAPSPEDGVAPVSLTESGTAAFGELRRQHPEPKQ